MKNKKKLTEKDIHLTEKNLSLNIKCTVTIGCEVSEGPRNLTIKSDMTLFMKCDLVCIIIARGALTH